MTEEFDNLNEKEKGLWIDLHNIAFVNHMSEDEKKEVYEIIKELIETNIQLENLCNQ